jgi:O-antigen/teichoic acid export membrane protein
LPAKRLQVSGGVLMIIGIYQMLRVWTDTFAMVFQSMSLLKPFWIIVPIQSAISLGAQIVFVPSFGLYGIYIALICSFVLTVSWFLPFYLYKSVWKNLFFNQAKSMRGVS